MFPYFTEYPCNGNSFVKEGVTELLVESGIKKIGP